MIIFSVCKDKTKKWKSNDYEQRYSTQILYSKHAKKEKGKNMPVILLPKVY